MKKILSCIVLMVSAVLAEGTASEGEMQNPADKAFAKAAISIEAGEIYPWGDLIDAVENTHYIGLGFRYTYWDDVDGVIMFNYSYFKPIPKEVIFDGAHQFSGKLGLDWKFPLIRPVIIGAGFTCNWSRADLDEGVDKDKTYTLPGGTLNDNETEFGWYGRIAVPFVNSEKLKVGFNILWEELWTLPKRSDMLTAGIYVERSLW